MEQKVIDYFNSYFGGELNESTSQNDLLEAAIQLIELRNLVLEEISAEEKAERLRRLQKDDVYTPLQAGTPIKDATTNSIAKQLGAVGTDINIEDLKNASAVIRRKAAEEQKKRHGRGELGDRGRVARKGREQKGQGRLF